jgi:hypothetical protein
MSAQQLLQSLKELASASDGQVPNLRSTVGAFISAALAISRIPAQKLLDDLLKEFLKRENDENGQGPSIGSGESLAVVSTFVSAAMHLLEKEGEVDSRCGQCQWFVFHSAEAANYLEGAYQAHNSGDQLCTYVVCHLLAKSKTTINQSSAPSVVVAGRFVAGAIVKLVGLD